MKPVIIREEGRTHQLPLSQFEDDLRSGRLAATVDICFPPWTGDRFCAANTIPQLWEALDSPQAMTAKHLRNPPFPWLSMALTLLLLFVAFIGQLDLDGQIANFLLKDSALGWEETLLKGKWWTPWTAQLVHIDHAHLFFNVIIVAYCGWRVEQAVGWVGALQIATSAILTAAALVCLLGEGRVVGGSMLAFGLWGGQIALGFRLGEAIPASIRSRYGWGNLLIFIPLYIDCLMDPSLSHLGHLGALSGGVLSALFGPLPSFGLRAGATGRHRFGLLLAFTYSALTFLLAWGVSQSAFVDDKLSVRNVDGLGLAIPMPKRLIESSKDGLRYWSIPNQSKPLIFVFEQWGPTDDLVHINNLFPEKVFIEVGEDNGLSWKSLDNELGLWAFRNQEGERTLTVGCAYDFNRSLMLEHCQRWVMDSTFFEPTELLDLKNATQASPKDRELGFALARYLERLGRWGQADLHYTRLIGGADAAYWKSLKRRVALRAKGKLPGMDGQLKSSVLEAPFADGKLRADACDWLYRSGDCKGVSDIYSQTLDSVSTEQMQTPYFEHIRMVAQKCP